MSDVLPNILTEAEIAVLEEVLRDKAGHSTRSLCVQFLVAARAELEKNEKGMSAETLQDSLGLIDLLLARLDHRFVYDPNKANQNSAPARTAGAPHSKPSPDV